MSGMRSAQKQGGYVNGMLVSLISVSVVLVAALSFGLWAFLGRQDYKNNSDKKSAAAVAENTPKVQAADAARYAEEAKNPLKSHTGPGQFGSINVKYPKTWSGYVIEGDSGTQSVNDYFHPDLVPSITDKDNSYSLRIQVFQQSYDTAIAAFNDEVNLKKATAKPYALPKVPTVIGTRIDGQIEANKKGSVIIFPLRNMTLKIWTESPDYLKDFDNIILPNLSFVP